jgi:cytoskeletal protein RodZ
MNTSEQRLQELENQNSNTLFYVLVIVVLLLVTAFIYSQYQESKQKTKTVEVSADTKELTDTANSLKTGSSESLDSAENEGDVDAGTSATIESHLDDIEKA